MHMPVTQHCLLCMPAGEEEDALDAISEVGTEDGSSALQGLALGPTTMSTITFVDLAGSERMSQAAGAEDADKEKLRMKEVRCAGNSCGVAEVQRR